MIAPKGLSTKLKWQEVYNNFKVLCNNQQNTSNNILNNMTKILKTSSIKKAQDPLKKLIYDKIGDYFTSILRQDIYFD